MIMQDMETPVAAIVGDSAQLSNDVPVALTSGSQTSHNLPIQTSVSLSLGGSSTSQGFGGVPIALGSQANRNPSIETTIPFSSCDSSQLANDLPVAFVSQTSHNHPIQTSIPPTIPSLSGSSQGSGGDPIIVLAHQARQASHNPLSCASGDTPLRLMAIQDNKTSVTSSVPPISGDSAPDSNPIVLASQGKK